MADVDDYDDAFDLIPMVVMITTKAVALITMMMMCGSVLVRINKQ